MKLDYVCRRNIGLSDIPSPATRVLRLALVCWGDRMSTTTPWPPRPVDPERTLEGGTEPFLPHLCRYRLTDGDSRSYCILPSSSVLVGLVLRIPASSDERHASIPNKHVESMCCIHAMVSWTITKHATSVACCCLSGLGPTTSGIKYIWPLISIRPWRIA